MSEPVRILIVEDASSDYDLAQREIRNAVRDAVFQQVQTRDDFLRALETFRPDLILSDYYMPAFDGLTALRLTQEHAELTPFIIWTGTMGEDAAVEMMRAGAVNYILKDNIKRLGPAVAHALEERRLLLEHKRAEEIIHNNEKRLRVLIENGRDNISLLAKDGTLLWESPATVRGLGYEQDEFVGRSIFELMHPDELQRNSELYARLLQEPGSREDGIFRLRRKDGSWRWNEATVTNMLNEPGVNAIVVNYRDITERKQAEMERQALLEIMQGLTSTDDLHEFLQLIHSSVGQVIYAENFFVVFYNRDTGLFEETYSVDQYDPPSPPSALGKSITSYVFRSAEPLILTQARFNQLAEQGEVELVGTDSASWLGAPLKTPNGTIGVIAVQDYDNPNRYTERDRDFLALIGSQVALALERKQAEDRLRLSDQILQRVNTIVLVADSQGNIVYVSPAARSILGYEPDELLGDNWWKVTRPDQAAAKREKEAVARIARGEVPNSGEAYERAVEDRSGNVRWISWVDAVGMGNTLIGVGHDITERKQAEKALRQSENRYSLASKATNDVIWEWEQETNQLFWNENALAVFGYSAEEIGIYETWWEDHIHVDDRERVLSKLSALTAGDQSIWTDEYRFLRRDGSYASIIDRAYVDRDASGKALRVIGAMSDITERKQAEDQLNYHARLLRHINDAVIATDGQFRISAWNRAAEKMYGWHSNEVMGHSVSEILSFELSDEERLAAREILKESATSRSERIYKRRDGRTIYVEANTIALLDQDGRMTGYVSVHRDITERRIAEEKLQQQNQRLKLLRDIDMAILAADSVEEIVGAALSHVRDVIKCRRANLTLIDWETNELVIFEVRTAGETDVPGGSRLPIAQFEDIIQTLSQNQPILLSDLRTMAEPGVGIQRLLKDGLRSTCSQPLFSQGKLIGMFTMHSETPGFFDKEKIDLGREVANQLAIAITQSRLVEALHQSEEQYRGLFEDSPVSLWVEDFSGVKQRLDELKAAGIPDVPAYCREHSHFVTEMARLVRIIDVNNAAMKLYHARQKSELIGSLADVFHIVLPEQFEAELIQIANGRLNFEREQVDQTLTGEKIHVNMRWSVAPGYEDSFAQVIVSTVDVTERRHAEEVMRQSQADLETAEAQAHLGSWSFDPTTQNEIWSKEMFHLFGRDPVLGTPSEAEFMELIHPDDRGRLAAAQARIFAGGEAFSDDYRTNPAQTPLRVLNTNFRSEKDRDGKVLRVLGTALDITERKRAEEQIQLQLQRVRALRTIDIAISSSFDLQLTLNLFLDQVIAQLKTDAAVILLFHPSTRTLEHAASRGFRSPAIREVRLRIGEGYAGKAVLQRRIMHISAVSESDSEFAALSLKTEKFIEYYCVPLIVKGEVKGVLEVFHRSALAGDPEWVDFLETLAGQAAIAIDNATLFENVQLSNRELFQAYDATIEGWSHALDLRDKETEGHTLRVTELTLELARKFDFTDEQLRYIRWGALLHDIGKMGVPDHILLKPDKLTDEEWSSMKKHPVFALEMLSPIAYLKSALDIPYCHHEKWDGTGYPRGLKGEVIPLAARVFAIMDVWDALRSDRPYRKAWSLEKTVEHIKSLSGRHFDPKVVEYFLEMIEQAN